MEITINEYCLPIFLLSVPRIFNAIRYKCHRGWSKKEGSWIFSRYSAGWHCGLHADWTELTACVDGAIDRQEGVLLAQHSRTAETQSSIGPRGRSAAGAIQQVAASGLVYAGTTSSAGSSSSSNSQQLLVPLQQQQQQQLHSLKRRYFTSAASDYYVCYSLNRLFIHSTGCIYTARTFQSI